MSLRPAVAQPVAAAVPVVRVAPVVPVAPAQPAIAVAPSAAAPQAAAAALPHEMILPPAQTAPVPVRSTGASQALNGHAAALAALKASTVVIDMICHPDDQKLKPKA
jgi:2,5-dihydroxypyridine 5,6-dioxygenase